MKKNLIVITILTFAANTSFIQADVVSAIGSFFTGEKIYNNDPKNYDRKKETNIGVEILNKKSKDIWVTATNAAGVGGLNFTEQTKKIPKGKSVGFEKVDITQPTEIAVWAVNPNPTKGNKFLSDKNIISEGKWSFKSASGNPFVIAGFTPNKTMYLTIDEERQETRVRPQTGPRGGAAGKTNTDLSLKNNVTTADIKMRKP